MKPLCVVLVVVGAFAFVPSSTGVGPGAEALVNGNLEEFENGLPAGWTVVTAPSVELTVSTTQTSPFTDVYPISAHSVYFSEPVPDGSPLFLPLSQHFTPFAGPFSLSFDFMVEGSVDRDWLIMLGGTSNPDFYLRIGSDGFKVSDGISYGDTPHLVTALTPLTWYHVSVAADPATFTYNGYILPHEGIPIAWEDLVLHHDEGYISNLDLDHSDPGALTTVYWDNFSVSSIPEPHALGLLTCGLLALRGCRTFRA